LSTLSNNQITIDFEGVKLTEQPKGSDFKHYKTLNALEEGRLKKIHFGIQESRNLKSSMPPCSSLPLKRQGDIANFSRLDIMSLMEQNERVPAQGLKLSQ
jgi:hypothetical protein